MCQIKSLIITTREFTDFEKKILAKNNGCLCGYGSFEMNIDLHIIPDSYHPLDCPKHSSNDGQSQKQQLTNNPRSS